MRKPIIVGNWKMNKNNKETLKFFKKVDELAVSDKCDYGIACPFTDLASAKKKAKNLVVAAENCHFEDHGAFTGEVSIPMLKELGVTHCIIGHSERRQYFGETDETVNKKVKALFDNDMTPIMCIGETEKQFDKGETEKVIRTQLQKDLKDLDPKKVADMIIAYEPIWAIGTGKSATKEIAEDSCKIVRDEIKNLFGKKVADKVRIQYGGSVKPENIAAYMKMKDIDGALVGGASLKEDSFLALVDATK